MGFASCHNAWVGLCNMPCFWVELVLAMRTLMACAYIRICSYVHKHILFFDMQILSMAIYTVQRTLHTIKHVL